MKIENFDLENIGLFNLLSVPLAPTDEIKSNVTVLIGNNGAGKTTILRSLATSLSWFIARLRSEKGSGNPIIEEQVLNGKNSADIKINVRAQNSIHSWTVAKVRAGRKGEHSTILNQATKLADFYRNELSNNERASLPLIVFYPVERVVLDIPLKIKEKHSFFQLDGYDNSLNQGVDFRRFFEWFREREDSENENGIPSDALVRLKSIFGKDKEVWDELVKLHSTSRDRQLTAVRTAIGNFMPGFSNLQVRRKPRLHMSIDKGKQTLNVSQLSQGEKSLMALVGDIARRLAMMNPSLKNPLHGDGIVLIDEVDMHLHPKWARDIISRLTKTFPNCQFILTTHSPLVISDSKNLLVYALTDGKLTSVPPLYGQDVNSVLLDVMDTQIRNSVIAERLNNLLDFIQNRKLDQAKKLIHALEKDLPAQNIELSKARLLLRKEEIRLEKN